MPVVNTTQRRRADRTLVHGSSFPLLAPLGDGARRRETKCTSSVSDPPRHAHAPTLIIGDHAADPSRA